MEIEEVFRREKESFDLGVKVGIAGVVWFEFLVGVVVFTLATLVRVW